jgi:MFS family permease
MAIPRLLQKQSLHSLVVSSMALWVVAAILLAVAQHKPFALLGAFVTGASWVGVFASLSAGTQSTAPAWVRARAVGINLVAVQAAIAIGSLVWGVVASMFGIRIALGAAGAAMAAIYLWSRRYEVAMGTEADVTPGAQAAEMVLATEPDPDDGPVLIQLEYRVDPEHRDEFLRAIEAVGPTRRRNGATSWRVFRDLADDGRFVERFIIASWAEYVRLRTRMTVADRALQDRVEALQRPDVPVRVSRLLGVTAAQ